MSFTPKLESLPAAQRKLWPELKQAPRHFVLYGGTALALRLGHRQSVDFDFFSSQTFVASELLESLPFLGGAEVMQQSANTLNVTVRRGGEVKLQFLGGLDMGRVVDPDLTSDGVALVASLYDLAATKMKAIWDRGAVKDYLDIHALLLNGVPPAEALSAALAIYGEQFNPMISLRAMADFTDGDLPGLPAEVKRVLSNAAGRTCIETLPTMSRLPGGLAGSKK
jgi:hypothetical protein